MAFEKMVEVKNARVLYTTPTYEDLTGRYREAVLFFEKFGATAKEGEITLNGSILDMRGIYRYDGLRGSKYHRFIGDEWAHSNYAEPAWNEAIRATLSDYEGDAYFFSTPKGNNHFKQLDERSKVSDLWQSFHFSTYDNPYIKPSEIDEARNELPSSVFRQEYLAEYVDGQGARLKREWLKYTDDVQGEVCIGVDLAISQKETADYTAIVAVAKRNDDMIVVDAIRGRWSFIEQQQAIVAMAQKWNAKSVAVESVQYQAAMVQELVRKFTLPISAIKVSKDKVSRFTVVEGKAEHGYLYLRKGLDLGFENEILSFPESEHDDYSDALVHAVNAHGNAPNLDIFFI
jgi:predicted phage terminase large subunit-like protein